jgi:hypothetical protein
MGDYVQFGRYADAPIMWRVIEDSANPEAQAGDPVTGDPLLFSATAICKKPFDAAGPHHGNSERLTGGSNLWQDSNLRAWLNSSARAGAVTWPCGNPPTKDSVESNDYAGEQGFLAAGNFNDSERNLIKPVAQKVCLYSSVDVGLEEGGSTTYDYGGSIDTIVANYDSAYYQTVTDRVFLLDPKQVNGVYKRFGSYYEDFSAEYWLRAPDSPFYVDSSAANVLTIEYGGDVLYREARSGSYGVRPALTLYLDRVVLTGGDGTESSPYVVTGE